MAAGDLSITALYTSQVWAWGGLSCAHLFATPEAKRVFDVTNAALGLLQRNKSLRHGLLQRHAIIDQVAASSKTIIELAAGLSRRGAAFTADPQVRYVEIDLPAVVARKRQLLERTAEGRAVLARPGFELVAADVDTVELARFAKPGDRTCVIAEGLAMYLTAEARRRLFAKARQVAMHLVFDLVPTDEEPAAGLGGRVLEAAMKRFTGGRSFERDARTRDDVIGELVAAGWDAVRAITPRDVAEMPYAERATTMVVFSATAPAIRS